MNTSVSHLYQLRDKICSFKHTAMPAVQRTSCLGKWAYNYTPNMDCREVSTADSNYILWVGYVNTLRSQSQPSTKGIYIYVQTVHNHPVLQCSHSISQWWYYFHRNM